MKKFKPTEAELTILGVLWSKGPSTVREVWEELTRRQQTGYTTVLKTLQIMLDKNLVKRDDAERSHIYTAEVSEASAQKHLVGQLVDRVFAGSASKLVLQALSARKASPEELAEIRKMLDEMERGDS